MLRNILIVLALALLSCSQAWAGRIQLWGHVASHHFVDNKLDQPWNEINPGLGVNIEINDHLGFEGGFFENSYTRPSEYAGVDVSTDRHERWGIGTLAGRVYGYRNIEPVRECKGRTPQEWECEIVEYEEREERARWGIVPYVRYGIARVVILGEDAAGLSLRVPW